MGSGTTLRQAIEQQTQLYQQTNPSELKRDFNEIELDEIEQAEALRIAREEKYFRLKRIQYLEKVNADRAIRTYTYEELSEIIHKELTIDPDNEEIIRLLCLYATKDERFELEGFKLNKGICLFGGVGVGKTTILKMLSRNQHQSYIIKMCRAVEDEFAKEGDMILRQYGIQKQAMSNSDPFGHQVLGYCFDDLGTEPISRYYGKECNVMTEILLNRYDNDLPFNQTHITTNLSIEEIRHRYGSRVTDRMRQMFNLMAYPENAKSRRV